MQKRQDNSENDSSKTSVLKYLVNVRKRFPSYFFSKNCGNVRQGGKGSSEWNMKESVTVFHTSTGCHR